MILPDKRPQLRAVLYARVSSKDQEKEGFSIPAQQRLLREYAAQQGMVIAAEFVDVETARRSGRDGFGQMLAFLNAHERTCRTIIVEKTDRLYRNIADWVTIDDLGLTVHFVKENTIIGPASRSSDQFMHGIRVLMARNYSLNLGEETKKGQLEKARSGIYPSFAPAGYKNIQRPDGKRIIAPQPEETRVIQELFRLFATGNYSLKTLAHHTRKHGITLRGNKLYVSGLHQILRKRIYTGEFDYDGTTYQGTHEPLITKDTWDCVQRILNQRNKHHTKAIKRDFPFTGLIRCGHCQLSMVAELKKKRYVYYHCTGHHGKCPEPYTRQETLINEFASTLGELVIPKEILEWLAEEVTTSDHTQTAARAAASKRAEAERQRLQKRLITLYDDRLDGSISKELYDEKAAIIKAQLTELEQKLASARAIELPPLTTAVEVLRLTSSAAAAFRDQPPEEQRKLLMMTLKEASWKSGRLRTTLLEPFELLRRSNHENGNGIKRNGTPGQDFGSWLPKHYRRETVALFRRQRRM